MCPGKRATVLNTVMNMSFLALIRVVALAGAQCELGSLAQARPNLMVRREMSTTAEDPVALRNIVAAQRGDASLAAYLLGFLPLDDSSMIVLRGAAHSKDDATRR